MNLLCKLLKHRPRQKVSWDPDRVPTILTYCTRCQKLLASESYE